VIFLYIWNTNGMTLFCKAWIKDPRNWEVFQVRSSLPKVIFWDLLTSYQPNAISDAHHNIINSNSNSQQLNLYQKPSIIHDSHAAGNSQQCRWWEARTSWIQTRVACSACSRSRSVSTESYRGSI